MANTIDWPGASGKTYKYWFASEMETPIMKQEGGNYMFATQKADGWYPVYIGETGNLDNRLTNHPELPCVYLSNGTRLMAHTTPAGKPSRLAEEADLIAHWNPPCNG